MANVERRLGARFPLELPVELHTPVGTVPTRAVDVSRHGLFVACAEPPAVHQSILLTIKLGNGSFETLANVARRMRTGATAPSAPA